MKIFVSGSTGFIGNNLAMNLARNGNEVHALYRSDKKLSMLDHPGIKCFKGDVLDPECLRKAMKGCTRAYHTAAFTKAWGEDSFIFRLNIEGTVNVIEAGMSEGVEKFVCTSTAGVFGPSEKDELVDEKSPVPLRYFTSYESSKALLEKILKIFCCSGAEIVMVNPTRVFGPGILSESNSVTKIIKQYSEGKWRIIPGDGKSIGNYVFIDDVTDAHILAMEKGKSGERYIIGGTNISYNDLFKTLSELTGEYHRMIHVPLFLIKFISNLLLVSSQIAGSAPLLTPSLARKYACNWKASSSKAENELGYRPTDFRKGVIKTINWLNQEKLRNKQLSSVSNSDKNK